MKNRSNQSLGKESQRGHPTRVVLKVIECIRGQIGKEQWKKEGCTPPVRELKVECGASMESVLKALRYLVANGELVRIPGRNRYYLPDAVHDISRWTGDDRPHPRWVEISEKIRSELEQGRYAGRSELPPAKALRAQHHCAHATIRRSLLHLQEQSLIRRWTRNVWQIEYGRNDARGYCFVGEPNSFTLFQGNAHKLVQELEIELQRRNWGPLRFLLRERENYANISSTGGWFHIRNSRTPKWLAALAQTRLPAVIIDALELGEPLVFPEGIRAVVLKCDNKKAGFLMGRHLMGLGHREVVYFPPLGAPAPWAQRRLAGLRSASAAAPEKWTIHVAEMPEVPVRGDSLHADIKRKSGDLYRQIKEAGKVPEIVARTMTRSMFQYLPEHRMSPAYSEAFAEAFTKFPAGVWVCANDYQALAALQFLRSRRIRVPERIALASFDNMLDSYLCDLTSFDFGFAQMAHIGLEHLLRNRVGNPPIVRSVSGTVIPRSSTNPKRLLI